MLISKKKIGIIVPDFEHCAKRVELGDATPLEIFIYNHEPANEIKKSVFRQHLLSLLESST